MFQGEIDSYKRNIDLRAYAASLGYQRDAKESWNGADVMRHPNGDKIFVKFGTKRAPNHWGYYSFHSDGDHGSIVDFVERRRGLNLKKVRSDWAKLGRELRPWLSGSPVKVPDFAPPVRTPVKDRHDVEFAFARMQTALRHPYLEDQRAIPASLLESERFAGRVRIDERHNAVFPHFDKDKNLCGYEIKNRNFTGYAPGGTKGLFLSKERDDDNRLVFCESGIDALSFAALFPEDRTRYASISGKPNTEQPEQIRVAIAAMPSDSEIVAAMDNDADGAVLARVIEKAFGLTGRADLKFALNEPFGVKDWNELLQQKMRRTQSLRPEVPSVA